MCKKTNYKTSNVRIDKCMQRVIETLKRRKIKCVASCCGHGKYHITIVYITEFENFFELFSGVWIKRKKRFYKRDKKGFYFIPEVEEYWKSR